MASDTTPSRHSTASVVTIGETMALLTAPDRGLHSGSCLPIGIGGGGADPAG